MANEQNLKPFVKGDKRINRKGRPKSFDALRSLAQQIANEVTTSKDGQIKMTRVEAILRSWSLSGNHQLQKAFIEIAFGKVPDNLDITTKGMPIDIGVRAVDYRSGLAALAPRSISDSDPSGEGENPGNGAKVGQNGAGRRNDT